MKPLYILLATLCLASCYDEIDLDDYREEEGKNLLTLNSIVNPDSTVSVVATRTYFFSDIHNSPSYVSDLDMQLEVNGAQREKMIFNKERNLYESTVRPQEGDEVSIRALYNEQEVVCSDKMPRKVPIGSIRVERQGPMHIYWNNDYIFTYRIAFTDVPGTDNYYFLQYDAPATYEDRVDGVTMGERDFTYEFVFQQLADQINATIPGWEPYSPHGLPFSDRGIDGRTHTLVVKEIVQDSPGSSLSRRKRMNRKFQLYSISKAYYNYLVSILCNNSDDGGIHGGMIDLGISDPVQIYSNINGGTGILGSYVLDEKVVDILKTVGPFPK